MPAQPVGEVPPLDGALPASALESASERRLSAYIHVPYCRVRCGYCDFNTYTATELGPGASREEYPEELRREVELSTSVLGDARRELSTVFFGGGTPTLLPSAELVAILGGIRRAFGLKPDVEVTTEANPDTLDPEYLAELSAGGFTRVSLGMQSAVPHVLGTLERTHDPERIPQVVDWVRDAGLQVSLDLIYGTPGESLGDWERSVETALACEPDHISAYSLIIEEGTKMGAQVRRGELPMPDEDDLADKYEIADRMLSEAGLHWYEVSNWARDESHRCRHNIAYWSGDDWWGYGPGAHSHIGGVRFWNAKHPRAWADRLNSGDSPAVGREVLDAATRQVERILLLARVRDGLRIDSLPNAARPLLKTFASQGLLDGKGEWLAPTLRGRLMVDYMVRELVDTL